jgi:hypothetical protein
VLLLLVQVLLLLVQVLLLLVQVLLVLVRVLLVLLVRVLLLLVRVLLLLAQVLVLLLLARVLFVDFIMIHGVSIDALVDVSKEPPRSRIPWIRKMSKQRCHLLLLSLDKSAFLPA